MDVSTIFVLALTVVAVGTLAAMELYSRRKSGGQKPERDTDLPGGAAGGQGGK